jgi:hypothetical protein
MGESLGLDIKFEMENESELLDKKSGLNTLEKFNHNPYTAVLFMDAETAQKADGSPTIRRRSSFPDP